MSVREFSNFIKSETTAKTQPARSSSPDIASIVGGYDKSLTGEKKGMAIMEKLVEAAKSKGFNVTSKDMKAYVQQIKAKYESDSMYADLMDSYCSNTCHLGSVVGK